MLNLWRDQKALVYSGFMIVLFAIFFLVIVQKPTGMLDMRLAGNKDRVIMATEAPDYIQIYSPGTMKYELQPSDERLNDLKIDKAGKRIFVANKEGWLNIFYPDNMMKGKARRKLGDVLQSVALSGDEKYLSVGVGSSEDYNTRSAFLYKVAELENRDLDEAYPFAEISSKGDIQAIIGNPDPSSNRGYIISSQDDKMLVFDFSTGRSIGYVELRNSPAMFRCRPDGKKGYGSINARQAIIVVDLTTGQERALGYIKLPSSPYSLAFNADGSRLYVGSRSLPQIYVIDTVNDKLIETLTLADPYSSARLTAEIIGVSTDENFIYLIPQFEFLLVYRINHEGKPLEPVQSKRFPKEPMILDVIRPSIKVRL